MTDGEVRSGRSHKKSRYTLEPSTCALVTLREFLKATLMPYPDVAPYVSDIIFATHEAAKNAVVHNPGCDGPVDVTCEVNEREVIVVVSDRGMGFEPPSPGLREPDPGALAGRGIFLMHCLMDTVETRCDGQGTCVTLVKRIEAA